MAEVFISYRREDGQASAGRIYDRLLETFGHNAIFMDVDAIKYGDDFANTIDQAVSKCKVLIAVIGRNWLKLADVAGNRRIDNPQDFVRIEIRSALARNIRVIPVLVENASLPKPEELPDDLKPLLRRNAIQINHASFNSDVDRLIDTLKLNAKSRKLKRTALITLVGLLLIAGVYFFNSQQTKEPKIPEPFMFKVRVVSPDQPIQSFNEGTIALYIGKELKRTQVINGEAAFYNIPGQYNNTRIKIEPVIPGFERKDTGEILISDREDYVDINVIRKKEIIATPIRGSIINERNGPVRNAFISIASGLASGYTNHNGDFSFTVPLPAGEKTRMKVTVNNITLFNEDVVLSSTPINLKIDLTP